MLFFAVYLNIDDLERHVSEEFEHFNKKILKNF